MCISTLKSPHTCISNTQSPHACIYTPKSPHSLFLTPDHHARVYKTEQNTQTAERTNFACEVNSGATFESSPVSGLKIFGCVSVHPYP